MPELIKYDNKSQSKKRMIMSWISQSRMWGLGSMEQENGRLLIVAPRRWPQVGGPGCGDAARRPASPTKGATKGQPQIRSFKNPSNISSIEMTIPVNVFSGKAARHFDVI
jgi:hypothetical protein